MPNTATASKRAQETKQDHVPKVSSIKREWTRKFANLKRMADKDYMLGVNCGMYLESETHPAGVVPDERRAYIYSLMEVVRRDRLRGHALTAGFPPEDVAKRLARDTKYRRKQHGATPELVAAVTRQLVPHEENFFDGSIVPGNVEGEDNDDPSSYVNLMLPSLELD